MFKLSPAAAKQIRDSAWQSQAEGLALRLAAQRRQDGSIEYLMGFDNTTEADILINQEGVTLAIAPEYVPLLDGAEMDYVEMEDGESRFIFLNPNDETYIPPAGR